MGTVSVKISDNIDFIRNLYIESGDIVVREFCKGANGRLCVLAYVDGLVSADSVQHFVIKPLMLSKFESAAEVLKGVVEVGEVKTETTMDALIEALLGGDVILMMDESAEGMVLGLKGWANRGVQESSNETVVRGPKESFSEGIRINTSILRRRLKTADLVLKHKKVGLLSQTTVVIAYLNGKVDKNLLKHIEKQLAEAKIQVLADSGQLERLLEQKTSTVFPQVLNTERPDRAAFALARGKVVVLVDGSPFALVLPAEFMEFFQSPEDYYDRWQVSTMLRLLRIIGAYISLFLTSVYIAIVSFHPGMLPTQTLFNVVSGRANNPFPVLIEALMMEVVIELLREAGIRLPRAVGPSVGIVGGIVIGDAAIRAGITSPTMVVVVALTAVASFAIPSYTMSAAFRVLRFVIMILASIFGMYGIILVFIFVTIHILNLRSGNEYLVPQDADGFDGTLYIPKQMIYRGIRSVQTLDNELLNGRN